MHVRMGGLALAGAVLAMGAVSSATTWTVRRVGPTGKLTIHTAGGNLHWFHVSGCAGLLGDGDPATLSAAYTISPKQEITSP